MGAPDEPRDPLERVRAAYDPEAFRRRGHALIDRLADYLGQLRGDAPGPVLPWREPAAQLAAWPADFEGRAALDELAARVLAASNHLHHPRYLAHQVTAPLPDAALFDLLSALLNNGAAVYEMGPVATALERNLVRYFAGLLGMPAARADGFFTSGGSCGNLTALLAVRQARAGFDAWRAGAAGGPPLAILTSTETHYSVARAAQIMGLGAGGVIALPVDAAFRLRPETLPDGLARARAAGRRVVGVVASAGSTATGSFDPIDACADLCAREGLWLHVDGAHGAPAAFSRRHRALLAGAERADSLVWDAHKLMLAPALATAVIFRDGDRSYDAFAQEASYLLGGAGKPSDEWFNLARRTFECTKLMMSLKIYGLLALHGPDFFADYVDGIFALAARFAERVAEAPDFELAVRPQANIVCFRHRPGGVANFDGAALDDLQIRVRRRIVESGRFHFVQARLPAGVFLRVALMSPLVRDGDLDALLGEIREVARALLAGQA